VKSLRLHRLADFFDLSTKFSSGVNAVRAAGCNYPDVEVNLDFLECFQAVKGAFTYELGPLVQEISSPSSQPIVSWKTTLSLMTNAMNLQHDFVIPQSHLSESKPVYAFAAEESYPFAEYSGRTAGVPLQPYGAGPQVRSCFRCGSNKHLLYECTSTSCTRCHSIIGPGAYHDAQRCSDHPSNVMYGLGAPQITRGAPRAFRGRSVVRGRGFTAARHQNNVGGRGQHSEQMNRLRGYGARTSSGEPSSQRVRFDETSAYRAQAETETVVDADELWGDEDYGHVAHHVNDYGDGDHCGYQSSTEEEPHHHTILGRRSRDQS
jgi:hypothetical protein